MKKKNFTTNACLWMICLLLIILTAGTIGASATARVSVSAYDYDAWYQRMSVKFPEVFSYDASITAPSGEAEPYAELRFALRGAPGEALVSRIDGTPQDYTPGTLGFGTFFAGERFSVGSQVAYCFDYTTPAGDGSAHVASASFEEAGIHLNETIAMNVARAAHALTANQFALITQEADALAQAFVNPDSGKTFTKEAVAAVLKSQDSDALAFKRMLVQMMVWTYMNQLVFADYYPAYTSSAPYYDKEGQYHEGESRTITATTGLTALVTPEKLHALGLRCYYENDMGISHCFEAQYELEVGVPFLVPEEEAEIVRKVAQANNQQIESSGTVQVSEDHNTVILTAQESIPEWTSWFSMTDTSQSIFSSKPYQPGVNGQFIVNAESIETYRVRVKTADSALVLPLDILLTKSDAQSGSAQGNACLAGAEYTLLFTGENGETRTWVFQTMESEGRCLIQYRPAYKVSGPDLLQDPVHHHYGLPAGSLRIQESKAPSGYLLDEQIYTVFIKESTVNDRKEIHAYDAANQRISELNASGEAEDLTIESREMPKRIRIQINKEGQGDQLPSEASLIGIRFAIVNQSQAAVFAQGQVYPPGSVMEVLSLSQSSASAGEILSELDYPNGEYLLYELAMDAESAESMLGQPWNQVNQGTSDLANDHFLRYPAPLSFSISDADAETSLKALPLIVNRPAYGRVVLEKTSEDQLIQGFSFLIQGIRAVGGSYSARGTTDASGQIDFGMVPFGSYTVSEELNDYQMAKYQNPQINPLSFTLDQSDDHAEILISAHNRLKRGGLSLEKQDVQLGHVPQGDASLEGIRFAVIPQFNTVHKDGRLIPEGCVIAVISTDAQGHGESDIDELPMGLYQIRELRQDDLAEIGSPLQEGSSPYANSTYMWHYQSFFTELTEEGVLKPVRGENGDVFQNRVAEPDNPILLKYDLNRGENRPQGGGSLAGIRFALINRSANPIYVATYNTIFAPGQVIDILLSDADGRIDLPYTLPFGSYGVAELPVTSRVRQGDDFDALNTAVKYGTIPGRLELLYANDSYLFTDKEEKTFHAVIDASGNIQYDTALLHFDNQVVRGGIYFEKKIDPGSRHLPYILFRLTQVESGETHYIFLNQNAYFGTDQLYNPHSFNTNGLDALLAPYAQEAIIPQSLIEELICEKAWCWGIWFGDAPVNDEQYALPYGHYRLEELRCEANRDCQMVEDYFTISYDRQYHSFGTILNKEIGLATAAEDGRTHSRVGIAATDTVIVDTVFYHNLIPGHPYTLIATLWSKNQQDNWYPIEGVEIRHSFTAPMADFYEIVEIPFDASSLEGCPVVVFEELRDGENGEYLAEHKDVEDPKQTVYLRQNDGSEGETTAVQPSETSEPPAEFVETTTAPAETLPPSSTPPASTEQESQTTQDTDSTSVSAEHSAPPTGDASNIGVYLLCLLVSLLSLALIPLCRKDKHQDASK